MTSLQPPPNLTLGGILRRRFTVWRIGRACRRIEADMALTKRLWASIGAISPDDASPPEPQSPEIRASVPQRQMRQ